MTDQPGRNDHAEKPFLSGLPSFPDEARDTSLPPPLPNRARSWGLGGAIAGGLLGAIIGGAVFANSLLSGSVALGEAVGILFGLPVALAVVGGIAWALRGAIRDRIMESHDLAQQREIERRQEEDREWHGVKKILDRRNLDR